MTTDFKQIENVCQESTRMSTTQEVASSYSCSDEQCVTSALDVLSNNLSTISDPLLIQHTSTNVFRAAILEKDGGDGLR